jgi:hypothetical protein
MSFWNKKPAPKPADEEAMRKEKVMIYSEMRTQPTDFAPGDYVVRKQKTIDVRWRTEDPMFGLVMRMTSDDMTMAYVIPGGIRFMSTCPQAYQKLPSDQMTSPELDAFMKDVPIQMAAP